MMKSFMIFISALLVGVLFLIVSCVDIDDQNIYTQDYGSEVRFVNLGTEDADISIVDLEFPLDTISVEFDTVGIILDTISLEPLEVDSIFDLDTTYITEIADTVITKIFKSFGIVHSKEASSYEDIEAGSRYLYVNYVIAIEIPRMVFEADKKSTVFILADTSGVRSYVNCSERYIFSPPGISDSALVRVINGLSEGDNITVCVTDTVGVDILKVKDITYGKTSGYKKLQAGDYLFTITANAITISSDTLSFLSEKRYTVAVYNSAAKVFEDD